MYEKEDFFFLLKITNSSEKEANGVDEMEGTMIILNRIPTM
jgi:hypothetical protein